MATKMTKNEKFEMLKAIPAVAENAMLMEFIEHEQELLSKKNTSTGERKLTARAQENADLRATIMNILTPDIGKTISDILTELPVSEEITHSRVTTLLSQLVKSNMVERVKDKKTTLFKIAAMED